MLNKNKIGLLIGIVLVFLGVIYYTSNKDTRIDAPAPSLDKQPPPVADLNAKDAGALIVKNIAISKIKNTSPRTQSAYFGLNVVAVHGEAFSNLLRQLYGGPTSYVVITTEISRPSNVQLMVPILALKINDNPSAPSEVVYRAGGPILPFGTYLPEGEADVALDIHFLSPNTSLEAIQPILKLTQGIAETDKLWSVSRQSQLAEMSQGIADILTKHRTKFYDNLLQLHLDSAGTALPGRKLSIGNTGALEITASARPALFIRPNETQSAPIKPKEIEQYLDSMQPALEELLVDFWLNEGEGFVDTCRNLSDGLSRQIGLNVDDSAVLLWSLIHRHAWFAKNIDYQTDCLNEGQSAALNKLKLELPSKSNIKSSGPKIGAMNAVLASLVKVLRHDDPEKSKINLAGMIAERTTLLDRAGLWLFGDQIKQNDSGRILESVDQKTAIEQLFALPVSHFGCFSRGDGLKGQHRTTLAQFGASNELWELNFAFDIKGKIAGITLDEADNETICRAIDDRKTGVNACYFAKNAHRFSAVANAKCGG